MLSKAHFAIGSLSLFLKNVILKRSTDVYMYYCYKTNNQLYSLIFLVLIILFNKQQRN